MTIGIAQLNAFSCANNVFWLNVSKLKYQNEALQIKARQRKPTFIMKNKSKALQIKINQNASNFSFQSNISITKGSKISHTDHGKATTI